eukprot:2359995-Ditylum_brightwellii.AAC.1
MPFLSHYLTACSSKSAQEADNLEMALGIDSNNMDDDNASSSDNSSLSSTSSTQNQATNLFQSFLAEFPDEESMIFSFYSAGYIAKILSSSLPSW